MEFRVKAQGNQRKSLDFAGNHTKTAPEGLQHTQQTRQKPIKPKPVALQTLCYAMLCKFQITQFR